MTPGTYMRLRRGAAGLTIESVAMAAGVSPAERAAAQVELRALEAGDPAPDNHMTLVGRLAAVQAFRFDPAIYAALVGLQADPALPCPPICRGCGCTWNDACIGARGPCSWADETETLCSVCLDADFDHPDMGMVIAVADPDGDDCPDCGVELGAPFGRGGDRTCPVCDTTFIGTGGAGREGGDAA